jgi:small subunit ribosomal protein S3
MIERQFVSRKKKEYKIQEFIKSNLRGVGLSHSKIQRTPLGEKIVIYASRPGLIIGSAGSNIKRLTAQLKKKFNLDNPQIEISEIKETNLIAAIVAERIAITLEKYGTMRFKGTGHKAMADVLNSGARGVEILVSGKIPSSRARVWRFYQGYLKKCGHAAQTIVDKAYAVANLKSGIVGIQVSIMPPNVRLPDDVQFIKQPVVEEVKSEELKEVVEDIKENTKDLVKEKLTDTKTEEKEPVIKKEEVKQ